MNLGVVRRLFRDALPLLVILTVGTLATECLFVFVIGEFGKQDQIVWMRVEFVQRMMKTLLGAELTPDTSATGMMSFGLTHPLIYAMCWAFVLTTGTRIPASEVERGTADLLLTLPISRTRLHVSATASVAIGALTLTAATLAGIWIGERISPLWEPLEFGRLTVVACNLLLLNACIVSAALMVSSFASRRGSAVAIVLGWLLASFLLEFLGQLSETARHIGFMGILHYYRPLLLVRGGDLPALNLLVLGSAAIVMWFVGLIRFNRRDIQAV